MGKDGATLLSAASAIQRVGACDSSQPRLQHEHDRTLSSSKGSNTLWLHDAHTYVVSSSSRQCLHHIDLCCAASHAWCTSVCHWQVQGIRKPRFSQQRTPLLPPADAKLQSVHAGAGGFFTGWKGLLLLAIAVVTAIIVAATGILGAQNTYPRLADAELNRVNTTASVLATCMTHAAAIATGLFCAHDAESRMRSYQRDDVAQSDGSGLWSMHASVATTAACMIPCYSQFFCSHVRHAPAQQGA